jgi:hypothetical protein
MQREHSKDQRCGDLPNLDMFPVIAAPALHQQIKDAVVSYISKSLEIMYDRIRQVTWKISGRQHGDADDAPPIIIST